MCQDPLRTRKLCQSPIDSKLMHISAHEQQQPPQQPPVSQYARQLSQPNAMMPPAAPPPPTNDKVGPGWVPKNYLERVSAIYDYSADKDDELRYVKIICF